MEYTPGDFVLVQGSGFFDKLIQFGQSFHFPKQDAYWNHVALIVSSEGDIIEAIGTGVKLQKISKYTSDQIKIVSTNASADDRHEAIEFAHSCLSEGYGWITIVSTALCLLFGLKFSFGYEGEDICSGLVGRALERTQAIFPKDPRHLTPADLAKYYTSVSSPSVS